MEVFGTGWSARINPNPRPLEVWEGQPMAALVPIENADLETASLSTNRQFLNLIERARTRAKTEGAISSEEIRRRFE
jgi:hypothetical protein